MDRELRILMLEDNSTDAELIQRELQNAGMTFSPMFVDSREEFIKGLDQFSPDLILADYKLPSFDGMSALDISQEKYPDIPFIFVTGTMGEEWAVESLKRGAVDYVLKGRIYRLASVVKRALQDANERTERKRAEETAKKLLRAIEQSPTTVVITDPKGNIEYVNPKFTELTGYTPEEAIGQNPRMFQSGRTPLEVYRQMWETITSGMEWHGEFVNKKKNGEIFYEFATISAVKDDKDAITHFIAIKEDITERKRAEEALRQSEHRYRGLFESAPDIIYTLTKDGTIDSVNLAFEKITGWLRNEWIGKPFMPLVHPEDLPLAKEKFQQALRGKTISSYELRCVSKSGDYLIGEFTPYPTFEKGKLGGIVRDITERKRNEERLAKMNACFLSFGPDPGENINRLTVLCGELMSADCALYNRLDQGLLYSWGQWNTPPDYNPVDKPDGHICYDVIQRGSDQVFVVRNLMETSYAQSDPNVTKYHLQTYIGLAVKLGDASVGSICVVYQDDFVLSLADQQLLTIIAAAIGVEERRKQTKEDLLQAEAKYRSLFENAIMGIFQTTVDGRYILANLTLARLYGYESPDELMESIKDLNTQFYVDPNRREEFIRLMKEYGILENFESQCYCKDGSIIWISENARGVRDANGKLIGYEGTTVDITERKRAEKEIAMLAHSLRSVNECVSITDMKDNILFVNESFLKTYGYNEKELVGKHVNIVRSLNNPPELVSEILPATLSGGWQGEVLNKRKDGSEFPIYLSTTIITDKDGKPSGLIGVAKDITERKRAEKELIEAKEKAEESDKLKSEFLNQMSHEIRTPINIILGNTDYLNQSFGEKMDEDVRDCFEGIDLSSKRIIRTIDLILNVAELQTSGYKPRLIKIDLNSEVLNKLYQEHQLSAKQKGLELIYRCELKETKILADEYSVTQIFANLIDNAIKYTKKGKVEILLEKNIRNNIMVEIKDTGIGMSKEFLPRIFEPFVQEEQGYTRSFDGNGLGLALTKRYCAINNAVMEVESKKNVGSTFRVIFKN